MANRILDTQRAAGGNAIFDEVEASSSTQVNLVGGTTTEGSLSGTGSATVTPAAVSFVNLTGGGTTQGATSSTGAATVTPPVAGVVNLAGSSTTQGSVSGTGAASVARPLKTINLAGSNSVQGAISGTGVASVAPPPGQGTSTFVPSSRTVRFGATYRIVRFGAQNSNSEAAMADEIELPFFLDGKWQSYKDPDDKLFYAYDVSVELTNSGTTIASIQPVVAGVEVLTAPVFAGSIAVVRLGSMDETDGAENFCTLRFTCANTEQFDKTIWFVKREN